MECSKTLILFFACLMLAECESNNAEIVYPRYFNHERVEKATKRQSDADHRESLTLEVKSKYEGDMVIRLKKDIPVQDRVMVRTYT